MPQSFMDDALAEARAAQERAVALRPNFPSALTSLGNTLMHLRLFEPAIAALAARRATRDELAEMDRILEDQAKEVAQVPASLDAVLDSLEADHDFLLEGGVFTPDVISTWIALKRENEIDPLRLRPHPYEFALYYDV